MLGVWNDRLLRNSIFKSRTGGRCVCCGTGITLSASRSGDNPAPDCASTVNSPTPCCPSTSKFCDNPSALWDSTYNSSFTCASDFPRFTRNIGFSALNDNPCAQSCYSAACSKKGSASCSSTARFANTTSLNSDHATPFPPCSGSALRTHSGHRTSPSRTLSCHPGDSPFFAGKCDCTSCGLRRRLQFR